MSFVVLKEVSNLPVMVVIGDAVKRANGIRLDLSAKSSMNIDGRNSR